MQEQMDSMIRGGIESIIEKYTLQLLIGGVAEGHFPYYLTTPYSRENVSHKG